MIISQPSADQHEIRQPSIAAIEVPAAAFNPNPTIPQHCTATLTLSSPLLPLDGRKYTHSPPPSMIISQPSADHYEIRHPSISAIQVPTAASSLVPSVPPHSVASLTLSSPVTPLQRTKITHPAHPHALFRRAMATMNPNSHQMPRFKSQQQPPTSFHRYRPTLSHH